MGRIFFTAFLGAIAGLVAWAITAPFDPGVPGEAYNRYELWLVFSITSVIGLVLGAANGGYQGSKIHALKGAAAGLVIGALGGFVGYSFGGTVVYSIFGPNVFEHEGLYPPAILARIIGLTPMGAALGLVLGATAKSWKQALVGMVGGILGAAGGGAVFDVIGASLGSVILQIRGGSETGIVSRAVYAVMLGLGIGLFTSLLQRVTRTAWVRLILGRNEAKEWIVDAPNTFIGRNETVHIPLHGDPAVAPIHAVIQRHQGSYYLADCGSGAPTFLNGQPIQQVPLFSGAMITVGSSNLEFVLRAGSAPQKAAEALRSQYAAQGAVPVAYQGYAQPPQPQQPLYAQPQQPAYVQPQPAQPYAPSPSPPTQVQPAAAPVGSRVLVAIGGPLVGQRFEVQQPFEVGRDSPVIPMSFDALVSRRHASFVPGPVGIVLTDLGSTNGTFVNDQRIQTTTLRPGDLVKMGVTVFRVE